MSHATNFATPAAAQAALSSTTQAAGYFRQAGESFKAAQGKFFVAAAAVWLYLGDTDARTAAKDSWADSKDKAREYALKVFRTCAAAATAGHAAKIADVRTFSELQALATPPKKDDAPTTDGAAKTDTPTTDAPAAEQAAPQGSKLDALMAQFERMEALEVRMRTMAMNKNATAEDHRREALDMHKALEALRADMTATLSAPAAAE